MISAAVNDGPHCQFGLQGTPILRTRIRSSGASSAAATSAATARRHGQGEDHRMLIP
jgi:hypothetical protein